MHSEAIFLVTVLRKEVEIRIFKFVHAWYLDFLRPSFFGVFRDGHGESG